MAVITCRYSSLSHTRERSASQYNSHVNYLIFFHLMTIRKSEDPWPIPSRNKLKFVSKHHNETAHRLQLSMSRDMPFTSLKRVSLYRFSRKNLPRQPDIILTAHKGASNCKFRSHSQVGRQPSDISLAATVSEWSVCVEWCDCVISSGNCYLRPVCNCSWTYFRVVKLKVSQHCSSGKDRK